MNSNVLFGRPARFLAPAILLPALLAFVLPRPVHATPDHAPFSSIQVLGDSLSDTGRSAAVLTQAFGTTYPPAPYYPGHFSNGPVWVEQLAPKLAQVYQPLDNFAWAGANTGRVNVFPGLPGMLDELDELIAASPKKLDKKALYVVFGGANDFLRILNGGGDPITLINEGVANLIQITRSLHTAGAENIVVVDLPNIGLTPRAASGGPASVAGATYLSVYFNQLLAAGLDSIGFPVIRVSAFNLLNDIVAQPAAYGFTNVTDPGIYYGPAADTFLFWDDIHPTTRAHGLVADAVKTALSEAGLLKQLEKH
jgi:phospholipase/lecithinase/hemolysin